MLRVRTGPLFCAVLLVALFGFACPPASFASTKVVTDVDRGGSVQLKVGDILEVRLRSNPTTGYRWSVHVRSTPLLKLVGQSQTHAQQPGVGRPIVEVFRFQAEGAGEGILLLHYVRPWERAPADGGEEQFDLHVSIR